MWSALQAVPDAVRKEGTGKLLSRVIDAETIESASLQGGFLAAFALLELVFAAGILLLGVAGGWHFGLLMTLIIKIRI